MSKRVLDASVLLAVSQEEPMDQDLDRILDGAVISSVNLTEVLTKLSDLGLADDPQIELLISLLDRVEPFTESQARDAAKLRGLTKHLGLSLGDRACLALALELDAEVYTADQIWSRVKVGCPIRLIRSSEPGKSLQ